ncbi:MULTISPECIES: 2-hydroxycarboxylate transporter family protein [Acidaminococcus]|uniref:2-hydroxycarboxylate transporter family protein n=1 Tax=Acidaminococcus TaxID=904 RepID=UPI0023F36729|nr:2-hydroxycarboxylate transporter family protein [Acidaminococcus massiliensis]
MDEKRTLFGMELPYFILVSAITAAAMYLGYLPKGMVGAFPVMIFMGVILNVIGDHAPVIKTYFGGGAIVCIFASAWMCWQHLLPTGTIKVITSFMKGEGFLDFYIAALITGSMLSMNRKLLIKAAFRYMPAILGGVAVALGLAGFIGAVSGYGALKAVLFIAIPIMGGGMGAGAVPLSQIFGAGMDASPEKILSIMVPAVALGNALSIVAGGLLDRVGKVKPHLTGNGQMLRAYDAASEENSLETQQERDTWDKIDVKIMGVGLFTATGFMIWGILISKLFPSIHYYAWMILSVALCKAFDLVPSSICRGCYQWFQFIMKNFTAPLLIGIGVAYTDMGTIVQSLSTIYILLVVATVLGAIIGSGLVGYLVGFYPIEASITAGLCMSNMGGTGDVAVLSASHRMVVMPFAQISSRIGGAFMLLLSSLILQIMK